MNDASPGNDWAGGFVRGMNLRTGVWVALLDDEQHAGSLVPVLALALEHGRDPDMRPYKEPISGDRRERLIIGTAADIMNIYKYFRTGAVGAETELAQCDPIYTRDGTERSLSVWFGKEV